MQWGLGVYLPRSKRQEVDLSSKTESLETLVRNVCSFVSIVMGVAGMSNRAWVVDGVPILGLTVLLVLGGRCYVASCLFPW